MGSIDGYVFTTHTPHRVGIRATRMMTTLSSRSGVVRLDHVISIALLDYFLLVFFYVM